MSTLSEAERLVLSDRDPEQRLLGNRIAILENKVKHLIDESVEKTYLQAAAAEVDKRLIGLEKRSIESCTSVLENSQLPDALDAHRRITALESSLHELGAHFVKYQEELVAIVSNKFKVLMQQSQIQEDAMTKTGRHMVGELDSSGASSRSLYTSCSAKSSWETPTGETVSIPASEEPEKHEEVVKLIVDTRRDIEVMRDDLLAHVQATEKRLAALEIGHVSHHQKIQGLANAARDESPVDAKIKSSTGGVKQISMAEFDIALRGLTNSVSQICRPSGLCQQPSQVPAASTMPHSTETSQDRIHSPNPEVLPNASPRKILADPTTDELQPLLQADPSDVGVTPSFGEDKTSPEAGTKSLELRAHTSACHTLVATTLDDKSGHRGAVSPKHSTHSLPGSITVTVLSPRPSAALETPRKQNVGPPSLAGSINVAPPPVMLDAPGRLRQTFPFAKSVASTNPGSPGTRAMPDNSRRAYMHPAPEPRVKSAPGNTSPSPSVQSLPAQTSPRTFAAGHFSFAPRPEMLQVRITSPSPPPTTPPAPQANGHQGSKKRLFIL